MDASSRKILFISILVTLLTMTIIYYSFYTRRDIVEGYTPLVDATIDGIRHFRQIAQQRWASKSASGIGSNSDQQLDLAFLTFTLSADNVESALQKIRAEDLQVFKLT
jgi:hypothetical protein